MARRANNEGTTYPRKDGRWEAAAYFLTASGKRKRRRFYGQTREEARNKLVEAQALAQKGIPLPDRPWKLGAYLDYWLENVVRPSCRPTTYAAYSLRVRLNLKPGLGTASLAGLTARKVQAFFNEQIAAGHSVRKVHMMREVLRNSLSNALREELLARNVATLVKLPTYERDDIHPWSADEARQFLDVAKSDPLYPAFALILLYGLRLGEVLGLRWCDIDLAAGEIHVRQQLQRIDGALRQGPVKTKTGRRDLPLLGVSAEIIANQQRRQDAARDAAGITWRGGDRAVDLIFTTRSGLPIEPRNFVRSFHRVCKQQNIRDIKVHHVRHTTATLLKQLGVPARDAQLILGHSQIATTQQIYQHGDMQSRVKALSRVAELLQDVVNRGSSRQRLPSGQQSVVTNTASTPGADRGIRTHDPLFTKSNSDTVTNRLTEVNRVLEVCARHWHIGLVAVSSSRQPSQALRIIKPTGRTRVCASSVHAPRTSPSTRPIREEPYGTTTKPTTQHTGRR